MPVEESHQDFVKHVPWNKSGEDPEAHGDLTGPLAGAAAAGKLLRG